MSCHFAIALKARLQIPFYLCRAGYHNEILVFITVVGPAIRLQIILLDAAVQEHMENLVEESSCFVGQSAHAGRQRLLLQQQNDRNLKEHSLSHAAGRAPHMSVTSSHRGT